MTGASDWCYIDTWCCVIVAVLTWLESSSERDSPLILTGWLLHVKTANAVNMFTLDGLSCNWLKSPTFNVILQK